MQPSPWTMCIWLQLILRSGNWWLHCHLSHSSQSREKQPVKITNKDTVKWLNLTIKFMSLSNDEKLQTHLKAAVQDAVKMFPEPTKDFQTIELLSWTVHLVTRNMRNMTINNFSCKVLLQAVFFSTDVIEITTIEKSEYLLYTTEVTKKTQTAPSFRSISTIKLHTRSLTQGTLPELFEWQC